MQKNRVNGTMINVAVLCLFVAWKAFAECRSLIEETTYPAFCQQAVSDDVVFAHFKREGIVQYVLDTVGCQSGGEYLELMLEKNPDLFMLLDKFRQNDAIGDPITYDYGKFGRFSPTTLRYIKIASDLQQQFSGIRHMHIVEIGGGYGGLCNILNDLTGFASYTIVDFPECNALTRKYLSNTGIKNVHFVDIFDISQLKPCDLVISNYAFSQFDRKEQENFLEHIVKCASNGYMTMNFISQHLQSISIDELTRVLCENKKKGRIEKEHPNTHPDNLLVTWKADPSLISLQERRSPYDQFCLHDGNAVSYSLSGGRLGDNLLAYLHARWFAYKFGLPIYYVPFDYSDQFRLSDVDECLTGSYCFKNTYFVNSERKIPATSDASLFVIPYYAEYRFEYNWEHFYWLTSFQIDWQDPVFKADIKRCLTPKKEVATVHLPRDRITVGVHVRRGGSFDDPLIYKTMPLKFPRDDYYIQQIHRISRIFPDQPLYVYILTDDQNPEAIVQRYTTLINNSDIYIGSRQEENGWDRNVLEDFCSLQKFDCLIIGQSNFSIVASKIADFAVVITPLHATFIGDQPVIDEIELTFDGNVIPKK